MSLKTLLQKAGEDVNEGIKLVLPFSLAASSVLSIFMPGVGTAVNVAFIIIVQAENHFAGVPKGGPQKLAWALDIAGPAIREFVPDGALAAKLISDIADLLNKYDEHGQPTLTTT